MVNKIYMFNFVNMYISNFVYIFYYQDFKKLLNNLITIMVFKQLFYNIVEYVLLRCKVGWKISKVEKHFSKRE